MEMHWINLLGISLGLAMDAFAVSIAVGLMLDKITPRHVFRLSFHFGLFQFLMPILGYLAGERVAVYIRDYDHWIAFALLGYVGGKMLWEAGHEKKASPDHDPTRGLTLVGLSVATSIDALAVGLSMAFVGITVWIPSVVIGLVAAAMTAIGLMLSNRIGSRWGRCAETVGGIVLILIGLRVLITHLMQ